MTNIILILTTMKYNNNNTFLKALINKYKKNLFDLLKKFNIFNI